MIMSIVLCFIAGLFAACSYAPFEYWWLMPASLIILLSYWLKSSPLMAFWQGLAFAFGLYAFGIHWIFVLAHNFNKIPLFYSGLALIGVSLFLSLFIALIGYFQARFIKPSRKIIAIPALWVLSEWIRGPLMTKLPWLDLGYSQTTQILSAYAPIGGVNFISFILVLLCMLMITISQTEKHKIKLTICLVSILIIGTLLHFDLIGKAKPSEQQSLSIALIQLDIPMKQKWNENNLDKVIRSYHALTHERSEDLVVWPETAIPTTIDQINPSFWQKAKPQNGELVSGIKEQIDQKVFNTAVTTCDGDIQLYRKQQLVPFGEYVPLSNINRPLFKALGFTLNEFTAWQGPQPTHCGDKIKMTLSICFEIAFSNLLRKNLNNSGFIVNISEDGWFENHLGNYQRLQIAQMRAQEFSKPVITASNTGPSAIIDSKGHIIKATTTGSAQVISGRILPNFEVSFYGKWGGWINYLSMIIVICCLTLKRKTKVVDK